MNSGSLLLSTLAKSVTGPWIVIHGHKHHPKLSNAAGSLQAPIIFSAGSIGASLYPTLANHVRNQFHLLHFCPPSEEPETVLGEFTSWDWAAGESWAPASPKSGLPFKGGFGYRGSLQPLVQKLNHYLVKKKGYQPKWADCCKKFSELKFLAPDDLANLMNRLNAGSVRIMYDKHGQPDQLAFNNDKSSNQHI